MWIQAQNGKLYNVTFLVNISLSDQEEDQWLIGARTAHDNSFVELKWFNDKEKALSAFADLQVALGNVLNLGPIKWEWDNRD